ncbi:multidrug resistance-like protein [Apiospora marii]|uniref:Multidrug resistance-like protein n=1 Tax=Apiospora marii TaxID=335849 RepID=A0ABR1REV0_9PEZI
MASTSACADSEFGPVHGCRGEFDFSLLFEHTLLSAIPSGLFLVLAVARLFVLSSRQQKNRKVVIDSRWRWVKITTIAGYGAIEVALLVSWAQAYTGPYESSASLVAAVLRLLNVLALGALSWLEHAYSPRPSTLLNVYLLVSLAFDAVQTRTLWLKAREESTSSILLPAEFTASLVIKTSLLALEAMEKQRLLLPEWRHKAPEETAGIISRGLLIWLGGILAKGRKTVLSVFAPVVPRLALVAFTLCQPLLLRDFLRHLAGETTFAGGTDSAFIIAYGLVYLGIAISGCVYWRLTFKCIVKMRGCLVAAVYKKTTSVDPARCDMTAAVPSISTDMERIIAGLKDLHEIWANALQAGVAVWLLYRELGPACAAPAVVASVSSLGSLWMGSFADRAQVAWMEATQARVGATARAVAGIKSVKLLGLSESVCAVLRKLRGAELDAARRFRHIEVLTATIAFVPLLLSPVFTFLVFLVQARSAGRQLDTVRAFTSLGLLQLMTQPLVWLFQAIPLLVASLGCLGRVEKYLHAENKTKTFSGNMTTARPGDSSLAGPSDNAIVIRDGELGWTAFRPTLRHVNIEIPASRLTMIVGPVASGKSTLARALIGQLPHVRGDIRIFAPGGVDSDIAFCAQEPFIMYGTLIDNITGFSRIDNAWLKSVIHAVDLREDIAALPDGRFTNVGSKGARLSGGQQQRVAMARALFARKQIAIFDDVLSGLDATTKIKVFERALCRMGLLRQSGCSVVLCTHDVSLLPMRTILSSSARMDVWKRRERLNTCRNIPRAGGDYTAMEPAKGLTQQLGDSSIYKYLAAHIGLGRVIFFIALTCGWAVFSTIGPVWLNKWSSAGSSPSDNDKRDDGYYLGIYAAFQGLALVFLTLFSGFALTTMAVRAGTSLHQVLLQAMIWAPQSFFGEVDTGVTTNRFSQDIILVDGDMPMALLETLSAGLVALVQMVLIAVAAPCVAVSYPFLLAILYFVQSFYLRTSRQLRLLDLEARSPLQTHLLETIQGLATIRAFGWAILSIEANHDLVDASQRPVYLLYMVQRWLQLVLELIIALLAILVATIAPQISSSTSGGFLGVALVQLMSLSQELKMIVLHYANLETSLTAVSRIKAFEADTPSENRPRGGDGDKHTTPPPSGWPRAGRVSFQAVTVSYSTLGSDEAHLAVRDFSLEVPAGQKVAICGRSGSGKSTLIGALARMVNPTSGVIRIDGVDVGSLRPSVVRSAINTIPQEPFFFHRTVAANLDPTGALSDEVLCSALDKVQMGKVVEDAGGLRAATTLDNLSQGQKQLLALARAILKPSKLVLMDEATSSVDHHTANLMKQVIRDEFSGVTVIAVAHQLNTILDFDVVVVMDEGRIAEMGSPTHLLKTKSLFKDLWDKQ